MNASIKPRAALADWHIYYDPPPIPLRTMDWHYVHKDYDGAPDSHDSRYGHAESYQAALERIKELEEFLPRD